MTDEPHPADKYLEQVETYLADLRTWNPPSVPTGPLDLQLENIRDARYLIKVPTSTLPLHRPPQFEGTLGEGLAY